MHEYKLALRKYLDSNKDLVLEAIEDAEDGLVNIFSLSENIPSKLDVAYSDNEFYSTLWKWLRRHQIPELDDLLEMDTDDSRWSGLSPLYPTADIRGLVKAVKSRMESARRLYTEDVCENLLNSHCFENKIEETVEWVDDQVLFSHFRKRGARYVIDATTDLDDVSFVFEFEQQPTLEEFKYAMQLDEELDGTAQRFSFARLRADVHTHRVDNQWVKRVVSCFYRFKTMEDALDFVATLQKSDLCFQVTHTSKNFDLHGTIDFKTDESSIYWGDGEGDQDDDDCLCLDSDDSRNVVVEFKDSLTDQQEYSVKTLLVAGHKVHAFRRRLVDTPTFQMVVNSREDAFAVVNALCELERQVGLPKSSISFPA